MNETNDIVIVGSGHNALTAGAYLAAAGLKVLVLERQSWIGGGVTTREVTSPGFKHDTHSTGHIFIQANPLIANDELKLQSTFGLEYLSSPCYFTSIYPDGAVLQTFGSLEDTCTSIARFSKKDAEAYRAFVAKSESFLPMFAMGLFNPPAPFGSFMAFLEQSSIGRELIGDMLRSAYDIVTRLFENERVQMHFVRWASECMMGPETRGTGSVLFLMCSFTHKYNAKFPKGGSGVLSDSLRRCIEAHGGSVVTNADVSKLVVSGGRATGVKLTDGRTYSAKKAVIAGVHPHLLNDFVDGKLEADLRTKAAQVQVSDYAAMNTHYALNTAPKYQAEVDVSQSFAVEAQPNNMAELRGIFDDLRYGKVPSHLSVLSICTTNADPTRAPPGKATLYMYSFMPYNLAKGGAKQWDEIKEYTADAMLEALRGIATNMDDANIISRHVESPLDFERSSASFQKGDIIGCAMSLHQYMGRRPTPELGGYTVPGIGGLYLVGPFMHPGGGVIGGGRPVAIKVMTDLGVNAKGVIST